MMLPSFSLLTRIPSQTTLQYTCTCSSNHSSPALQYYAQTLPNSVCNLVTFPNCINKYTQDNDLQKQCKPKIQDVCGKATFGASSPSSGSPTSASAPSKTSGTNQEGSTVSTSSKSAFAAPTAIPLGAAAAAGVVALFL